jgi:hypothetical protein
MLKVSPGDFQNSWLEKQKYKSVSWRLPEHSGKKKGRCSKYCREAFSDPDEEKRKMKVVPGAFQNSR